MKRFGNLYEKICDIDNIYQAHERARKGKAHYSEVKMVDSDLSFYLGKIRQALIEGTFINSRYKIMIKRDGRKDREIWKLPYYPDRIVHHAIVNILEPIWMNGYIRDTYAALPGRGIHDGVRRVKRALLDRANTGYCLKMDVAKFYQSVNHDVLKRILQRKIKCVDTLHLLNMIIDSAPGVPIGNFTSQHFGNLVLSELDHWIKEVCRVKYYFRYCDDLVILDADKTQLHQLRIDINCYLGDRLKLAMKKNWQVFPVDVRGIDFLGYRFFHDYTLVRKSIVNNFKRAYHRHSPHSMSAYNGWFKWANTKNLQRKYNWKDKI